MPIPSLLLHPSATSFKFDYLGIEIKYQKYFYPDTKSRLFRRGKTTSNIALAIDIQSSLGRTPAQGLGFVSNTFIFKDENAERIGIYSQRVLK